MLTEIKRLVVKVGTSTLTHATGKLNLKRMDTLCRTLADLQNRGLSVILVTSGAISAGVGRLNLTERPAALQGKQAAAAVGQCRLVHLYDKLLSEYGSAAGQILLTGDDVNDPNRRRNLLGTFDELLRWGVLPVVNENDSVGIEEIESAQHRVFGDNDTLSAHVAALVGAEMLVLLTDIDGLYDADPRLKPDAQPIREVRAVDAALRAQAGGAGTARGTGGMLTKLAAGAICLQNNVVMYIAGGDNPAVLYDILDGKPVGTRFSP